MGGIVDGGRNGAGSDRKLLKIMREKGAVLESFRRKQTSQMKFQPEELRKAATRIQRWYRGVCAMYAAFGPMMFSRKDGAMADFGTVSFMSGTSAARWIRVSNTTSVGALALFMEKYWRLPRPDVLISVTGSAASLQLTSTLQRVFDRGLATAAAMTNAWIFTGGTDSGVMKLVADAIHKYGLDVPLVGIAPWGAVQNRRAMHGCKGSAVPYMGGAPAHLEGKLNPHHTHQILVDAVAQYSDGDSAWGHEIVIRSQLERVYAQAKGVPVVLLVIQGGPNTVDMMTASAKQGSPLLILSDSGGAATALWQFCEGGIDRVTDPAFVDLADKLEALRDLDASREHSLISFFSLSTDDAEESMSTALLRCLFRNLMFYQYSIHGAGDGDSRGSSSRPFSSDARQVTRNLALSSGSLGSLTTVVKQAKDAVRGRSNHMQRALLLAVKWNQVEFARRMLVELPTFEDYSRPLNKMLQHALELQRVEIVSLLLDRPGCSVGSLSLCQLYLQEDPYNFLRSDAALQTRLQRRLSDGTIARSVTPKDMQAVYKEIVGPFLRDVCPLLSTAIDNSSAGSHADLFFWAVLMGQPRLARELWAHAENPLHCALLASHTCMSMKTQITWGSQEVADHATEYEGWALSVMDLVDEQEIAHLVLSHSVEQWRMGSLCEIALQMHVKRFLAHRHCTSLMDHWWRGGYPGSGCEIRADESYFSCVTHVLLPFLNPYLRAKPQRAAAGAVRSREEREQMLYGALAQAMRHGNAARRGARNSVPLSTLSRAETRKLESTKRLSAAARPAAAAAAAVPSTPMGAGGKDASFERIMRASSINADEAGGLNERSVHFAVEHEAEAHVTSAIKGQQHALLKRAHSTRMPQLVRGMADEKARQEELRGACGLLSDYYSVPLIKYLIRASWHLAFLALYMQVLTHLATANQLEAMASRGVFVPPITGWEQAFMVWALSLAYEHRRRQARLQIFGIHKSSLPFQRIVSIGHLTLVLAIAMRLLSLLPLWLGWQVSGAEGEGQARLAAAVAAADAGGWVGGAVHSCYIVYATLMSFDAVLMCVELFTFMWTSLAFGVLAIIMGQMLVDLSLFLVFAVVFICGFSAALIGLSETALHPSADDPGRMLRGGGAGGCDGESSIPLVAVPVWAMFTDLELSHISQIPFALPLMLAFVLLANVVLVNLLIAMFADTYSRIKSNAETEYHYQRFLHIFEYLHVVETIPPPLSAPWLLLAALHEALSFVGLCGRSEAGQSAVPFAEALHRVAVARPVLGQRTQGPVSKKYVQEFLKDADEASERTPAGMFRKLEGLIGALDERVGQQLERLDTQLGGRGAHPQTDDEIRATVGRVAALLERVTADIGVATPSRTGGQVGNALTPIPSTPKAVGYSPSFRYPSARVL